MSLVALSSKPSQEGASRFCGSFWTFIVHHSVSQFIVKVLNIHFIIQSATLCVSQMLIPSTRCPYSIKTQGLLLFLHFLLFGQCSAVPLFNTDKNSEDIIQKSTLTALVCQGCCSEVTYVGWHKWHIYIFLWPRCQQHWFALRLLSFASMGLASWCLVSITLSLQCSGCTSFGHLQLTVLQVSEGCWVSTESGFTLPIPMQAGLSSNSFILWYSSPQIWLPVDQKTKSKFKGFLSFLSISVSIWIPKRRNHTFYVKKEDRHSNKKL